MKTKHLTLPTVLVMSAAHLAASPFRQVRIPVPGMIDDIAVGDFNGDGYADIAILDASAKKVRVFVGDSSMGYTRQVTKSYSKIGELFGGLADFTGDGLLDIAVDSVWATTWFAVLPGKGNGEFLAPKPLNSSSSEPKFRSLSIFDLDGDDRADLAGQQDYYGSSPSSLLAFRNLGGNKYQVLTIADGAEYQGLTTGDFDRDGFSDVVTGDLDTDSVYFYKSNGDGTFAAPVRTGVGSIGTAIEGADLNRDGKLDLVGGGNFLGESWAMIGKGNGQFIKRKLLPGSYESVNNGITIADLLGGTAPDIASGRTSGITLWEGRGNGTFASPQHLATHTRFDRNDYFSSGGTNQAAGDLNGDGKMDLVGVQWEYMGSSDPEMSNLVLFVNGQSAGSLTISNMTHSTLTYAGGIVTMIGGVQFQGTGVALKYAGAPVLTDNAFMEFTVNLDFPSPMDDYDFTYQATGAFLNLPGQSSGTISYSLTLPTTVISTATPSVSVEELSVWDYNLLRSNELPVARSHRTATPRARTTTSMEGCVALVGTRQYGSDNQNDSR